MFTRTNKISYQWTPTGPHQFGKQRPSLLLFLHVLLVKQTERDARVRRELLLHTACDYRNSYSSLVDMVQSDVT